MVAFEELEDPQKRAALAHDRNYHLTAGAGSGKTTTFASRYVKLLEHTETEPDAVAAITFTETGAMELQERVSEQVTDRLDDLDEQEYDEWRAHLDALPEAYIHTIHGFCARLLREYALTADVPIGFDIVEETAATIQKRRAVETFLDDNEDDPRVAQLANLFYRSRFEDLLVDLLDEHHEVRQWADEWGDKDPEAYVEFVAERFMTLDPAVAQEILEDPEVRTALEDLQTVAETEESFRRVGIVPDIATALDTHAVLDDELSPVAAYDTVVALCDALTTGDDAPYYGSFDSGTYSKYSDWSAENGRRYEEATTTLTEMFDVEQWVTATRFGVEQNASQYYVTLASVFQDVHDHYESRKRADGVLDFSDLIDAAIGLLADNPGIRDELRGQFDYLMLDEVQDTDPRQWELVELLTSAEEAYDGLNVFVVGDEKQSIFRFRGADVAQFAAERERLATANSAVELPPLDEIHPVDGDDDLATNFRSLSAVLEPINALFDELFGTIPDEYADPPTGVAADTSFEPDPQRLAPARSDTQALSTGVDLAVVPEDADLRAAHFDASHPLHDLPEEPAELDATALAAEVSAMLTGETHRYEEATNDDGDRIEEQTTLDPSDVAILLRKRTNLKSYERALAQFDVPYTVASGIGFYETTEIRALRNLLTVLNDPSDGLALYAILRSPLFGFEDKRIVRVWESIDTDAIGDGALWEALADTDDTDLQAARAQLARWRRRAGVAGKMTVVDTWDALLGQIIEETGFIASLATDERGQQAIANVEKFRDRLRAWSDEGIQTLPVLIDRLEREVDQSGREGDAEVPDEADGVRIMTVHDAKGREFPAVFVPGLSKAFNWQTSYADSTIEFESLAIDGQDEPLIGLKAPTVGDGFDTADTVLKERLKFARQRELVAEEKRILYVAMTRARDHLCLVGTAGTDDGELSTLDTGDAADPSSWFDFVGPAIFADGVSETLATQGEAETLTSNGHSITVRLPVAGAEYDRPRPASPPQLDRDVSPPEFDTQFSISASYLGSLLEDDAAGEITVDHTGQYVSYYPPTDESETTPSEAGSEDTTDTKGGESNDDFPRNVFGDIVHRAAELRVDAAETETIRDLARQYATDRDVDLARLDSGTVAELATHIDIAVDFLKDVNEDAQATADEIRVQADFDTGEVHGDIDHLAVTDSAYHIVDYKTNRLDSADDIDAKERHYRWQMLAYAVALHQTDPSRSVRATLLFTDLAEPRTLSWSPDDLAEHASSLPERIVKHLATELDAVEF